MEKHQLNKQYVYELLIKLLHQMEQFEQNEGSQFLKELRNSLELDTQINMTEIHTISCIGQHEPLNLTTIADKMALSKGNVSKVTTRLLKNGWVRRTQLNDNKKEVFFRLTTPGKQLYAIHEEIHDKAQAQFMGILHAYSEAELEVVKRFLLDLIGFYEQSITKITEQT
ncbi:transcriptional regulator [Paenibacillus sp. BIHB 4019]|uniref:Transcriptional regulator n=1 Tax=Paenibacillus sp. BIHB 4019 TaxID=1870819 RepID=A0A1B2DKX0_9BACL|nr:MarR family transcriptional regulator [Paenibacillus sp. BIHB 4019]ANY68353.1 transcriptional regulator [Paenibacillus sp. BIHB 4019]